MCAIEQCAPWDVVTDIRPRAHRAHRCTECSRTIRRGETYRKIHGLCDGYWATHKICAHCDAASEWMRVVCNGWVLESLYAELLDHWRDGYRSPGMFRLIAGMRRRWRDGRDPVPTGVGALARQMLGQVAA